MASGVCSTMAQALGEDLVQPGELQDDSSSLGSDSELSGPGPYRQADRYGFIGGSSAEPGPGHPPADLIRQREMKWVEMTSHWEKTMSRRYKKVKMQCRKGIPSALRARCWPLLCGAHVCQQNSRDTYQELAEAPGDPQWMETIGRDLHRQFPLHEMFVSPQGHGQQGLLQVLKAYTLYRPEQGYCQAQGPVAAVLLMYLPPEEGVQLDAEVFTALLRRLLPRVHKHLRQAGVGPLLYLPEWFLCLFARSLPFPTVLRVWDAFLSEGVKVLFRVGLTLVRLALGTTEQRLACPGLLETLGALRAIPPTQLQEEVFMSQVHSVALSEQDLQREIKAQLVQLPASASGPPPRPQARLPGAQAIFEAQQLAGTWGATRPEVPRIVVQPPEEPRPPRRKPQTRGKTFHGLLTRSRAPRIESPTRSHRGSTSSLDTRF
ncbi:carabin isoform X3 [Neophocaena asiaeorientalis asiaeorientalis]|uniref:Carabin n=1 Tax=Neophocaena asiaeorientalis asiaeorientalis TaxID=1706337 RepID=A0A341BNY6_NEOAA|nr:carabin isoform X3 [Neophocaena asiaeorientalis asiaeorientalis]